MLLNRLSLGTFLLSNHSFSKQNLATCNFNVKAHSCQAGGLVPLSSSASASSSYRPYPSSFPSSSASRATLDFFFFWVTTSRPQFLSHPHSLALLPSIQSFIHSIIHSFIHSITQPSLTLNFLDPHHIYSSSLHLHLIHLPSLHTHSPTH